MADETIVFIILCCIPLYYIVFCCVILLCYVMLCYVIAEQRGVGDDDDTLELMVIERVTKMKS